MCKTWVEFLNPSFGFSPAQLPRTHTIQPGEIGSLPSPFSLTLFSFKVLFSFALWMIIQPEVTSQAPVDLSKVFLILHPNIGFSFFVCMIRSCHRCCGGTCKHRIWSPWLLVVHVCRCYWEWEICLSGLSTIMFFKGDTERFHQSSMIVFQTHLIRVSKT